MKGLLTAAGTQSDNKQASQAGGDARFYEHRQWRKREEKRDGGGGGGGWKKGKEDCVRFMGPGTGQRSNLSPFLFTRRIVKPPWESRVLSWS